MRGDGIVRFKATQTSASQERFYVGAEGGTSRTCPSFTCCPLPPPAGKITDKMDSVIKGLMGQCPQNFWAITAPAAGCQKKNLLFRSRLFHRVGLACLLPLQRDISVLSIAVTMLYYSDNGGTLWRVAITHGSLCHCVSCV